MKFFKPHHAVPILMLGGIILSTILAVGHHLFYNSLDEQIVQNKNQQQWNLRIGTGLAFLVKALLTASSSLAFTQLLWYTLRSRLVTIRGIDAVFSLPNNLWEFTTLEVWRHYPSMVLVAIILWLLPTIAIFTPSALTVQPSVRPNETTHRLSIPVIDYSLSNQFAEIPVSGLSNYAGPSHSVVRHLSAAASQGSISQPSAPFPNCSYTIEFYGPSISCSPPKNTTFAKDIYNVIANRFRCKFNGCGGVTTGYVGFVPQMKTANWEDSALLGLNSTFDGRQVQMKTYDQNSHGQDAMRLLVVVPGEGGRVNRIIECGLFNTSYKVDFDYTNGQQHIKVRDLTRLNGVTGRSLSTNTNDTTGAAYISLMDALGSILIGSLEISILGSITPTRTHITSTVLMQTREMHRMQRLPREDEGPATLPDLTMEEALEQLFFNATMSLFDDSKSLQNKTVASMSNVIVRTPQNEYSYKPRNLCIAYSVGVSVAIIIVAAGLICRWKSFLFLNTTFSTILRMTRNTELDELVGREKSGRSEALPKYLGTTSLRFKPWKEGEDNVFVMDSKDGACLLEAQEEDEAGSTEEITRGRRLSRGYV